MAERINVTESWLSRYLDLARLPVELMVAFPNPQDLRIKHVTAIKPLLKPDDRRQRVFAEAAALSARSGGEGAPVAVPDIVRALALARSEEHTSELQSLMRISYAVFCLKKTRNQNIMDNR